MGGFWTSLRYESGVKISTRLFIVATLLLLSGCSQNLGSYGLETVSVTSDVPIPAETAAHYGRFVEVILSSNTSLTAISEELDAVYVGADFCPLRDPNGVITFGPFDATGLDLGLPSAAPAMQPDSDGKFRYRIYLPIAYRAKQVTQPGQIQLPTYDLRETESDLCLQLFAPGYNIIQSRSNIIRVPASVISEAQRRATSP